MNHHSVTFFSGLGFQKNIVEDLFASIHKPIIVGWSYGGLKAIERMIDVPQTYEALILIASSPCFLARDNWPGITQIQKQNFLRMFNRAEDDFINYYMKLIDSSFSQNLQTFFCLNKKGMTVQIDDLFTADLRSQFAVIQRPILIIHGDQDTIVPHEVTHHMKNLNPRIQINVIQDAGHAPFMSHRSKMREIIHDFLAH